MMAKTHSELVRKAAKGTKQKAQKSLPEMPELPQEAAAKPKGVTVQNVEGFGSIYRGTKVQIVKAGILPKRLFPKPRKDGYAFARWTLLGREVELSKDVKKRAESSAWSVFVGMEGTAPYDPCCQKVGA